MAFFLLTSYDLHKSNYAEMKKSLAKETAERRKERDDSLKASESLQARLDQEIQARRTDAEKHRAEVAKLQEEQRCFGEQLKALERKLTLRTERLEVVVGFGPVLKAERDRKSGQYVYPFWPANLLWTDDNESRMRTENWVPVTDAGFEPWRFGEEVVEVSLIPRRRFGDLPTFLSLDAEVHEKNQVKLVAVNHTSGGKYGLVDPLRPTVNAVLVVKYRTRLQER